MKYPNSRKTYSKPKVAYSNRGMSLEKAINKTNSNYLTDNIALIYKKPTPIQVVKVDYPKRSAVKIEEAYYTVASTTDYSGLFMGHYIDFEAKECSSKTSFPFSRIHQHQIKHLENVNKHGGIAFIIIRIKILDKDFLIKVEDYVNYVNNSSRKSLPINWIIEKGYEITYNYTKPCDYLETIKKVYKI